MRFCTLTPTVIHTWTCIVTHCTLYPTITSTHPRTHTCTHHTHHHLCTPTQLCMLHFPSLPPPAIYYMLHHRHLCIHVPIHACTHCIIILSLHQLPHTYDIIHMYTCTLHSVSLPCPPPLTYHSHQMNVKKLRGRLRLSSASLKTSWVNRYNSTFEHKTLHIVPCHGIFVMPITSEPTLSECYNNIT